MSLAAGWMSVLTHHQRGIAALVATLFACVPTAASDLEPWQMTRSLQLVQDRIADGDHAAMPMQRRLIEMIDERLRRADQEAFEDERNFEALMIYGMSGGNPSTFESVVSRLSLEDERTDLARGVRHYILGNPGAARDAFDRVEIDNWPVEVAAFVALVKGSVLSGSEPEKAIRYFDRARLLSPGTLVEEAALRRSIAVHNGLGDHDRFLLASSQYARRFLRSPYASQFAQGLVAGITTMFDHIDRRKIEEVLSWMTKEQAQTIYLRLARQAAIDGHDSMLEFASAKARQIAAEDDDADDARSMLYSTIASVTSDTVDAVVYQLRKIDRSRLSSADRALLEAAETIAAEVVARPRGEFFEADPPFPDAELDPEPPVARGFDGAAPAEPSSTEAETRTDFIITSARDKLEAVDRMLKEDRQ